MNKVEVRFNVDLDIKLEKSKGSNEFEQPYQCYIKPIIDKTNFGDPFKVKKRCLAAVMYVDKTNSVKLSMTYLHKIQGSSENDLQATVKV